jgi:hypothetical protein
VYESLRLFHVFNKTVLLPLAVSLVNNMFRVDLVCLCLNLDRCFLRSLQLDRFFCECTVVSGKLLNESVREVKEYLKVLSCFSLLFWWAHGNVQK